MNEKKKILITCFDRFGFHRENVSKIVEQRLRHMLLEKNIDKKNVDFLVLEVQTFKLSKKELEERISLNNYDIVISMGLYIGHEKCRLERVSLIDNNFISTSNFRVRYGKKFDKSFCYQIRDFLHSKSIIKGFLLEFIHIPQRNIRNEKRIEELSQFLCDYIKKKL